MLTSKQFVVERHFCIEEPFIIIIINCYFPLQIK